MLRLFFLRHGNTFEEGELSRQVGAKTDIPLTEKGRLQAMQAAAWLRSRGVAPTTVYSGKLKRQKETAAIVAEALVADVVEEDDLAELAYGAWENLTIEELKTRFPVSYEAWGKAGEWPPEFEGTIEAAQARLSRFLEKTLRAHPDGSDVVAVTSQGVLKLLTSVAEPERWADLKARRAVDELKVKTGAICEIDFDGAAGWKTVAWNVLPE